MYNMSIEKGDKVVSLLPMSELEQRFAEVVLDKNTICPAKMDPPYRPVPESRMGWFKKIVSKLGEGCQDRVDFWPFRSQNLLRAFNVVLDDGFSSSLTFYGLHVDVNLQSIYEQYMETPGEQQDFMYKILYAGRRDTA